MLGKSRAARPKLTLKIAFYAIFDVLGMLLLADGAMWFSSGKLLFSPDYAASMMEAGAIVAAGVALMPWAAAQMLRERIANQAAAQENAPKPEA